MTNDNPPKPGKPISSLQKVHDLLQQALQIGMRDNILKGFSETVIAAEIMLIEEELRKTLNSRGSL